MSICLKCNPVAPVCSSSSQSLLTSPPILCSIDVDMGQAGGGAGEPQAHTINTRQNVFKTGNAIDLGGSLVLTSVTPIFHRNGHDHPEASHRFNAAL
jgi:hypothetical protein